VGVQPENRLHHDESAHGQPRYEIGALELDSVQRTQNLYDTKNTVVGDTDTLLLSDEFIF